MLNLFWSKRPLNLLAFTIVDIKELNKTSNNSKSVLTFVQKAFLSSDAEFCNLSLFIIEVVRKLAFYVASDWIAQIPVDMSLKVSHQLIH